MELIFKIIKRMVLFGILLYYFYFLAFVLKITDSQLLTILIFLPFVLFALYIISPKKTRKNSKNYIFTSQTNGATFFNQLYQKDEKEIIKILVDDEAVKNGFNLNNNYIISKKRLIITIIFSVLSFLLIGLYFFHVSSLAFILEGLNIFLYIIFLFKTNIYSIINKQLKARPDDDISNVICSFLSENKNKNFKIFSLISIVAGVFLPFVFFIKPIMLYEKVDDGYYLRFCTDSLFPTEKIVVPEKHRGLDVVGLRGQVFSNLKKLEEVSLPDSVKVIRGQAFKNCVNLKSISLPDDLEYLGGGAFYNCKSLSTIIIPDKVKEISGSTFTNCVSLESVHMSNNVERIGGEAFMNCSKLVEIELPSKITEIHGSTFENCSSLYSIEIPDTVTRIGGSAFRNCPSLKNVKMSKNINEIGSSAFRRCTSLKYITIPSDCYVNERAFKETNVIINHNEDDVYDKVGEYNGL